MDGSGKTWRLIVDGLEGDVARVELEERTFDLPRSWLPGTVREGDCLRVFPGRDGLTFLLDHAAAQAARVQAQAGLDALNARLPEPGPPEITEL